MSNYQDFTFIVLPPADGGSMIDAGIVNGKIWDAFPDPLIQIKLAIADWAKTPAGVEAILDNDGVFCLDALEIYYCKDLEELLQQHGVIDLSIKFEDVRQDLVLLQPLN